MRNIVELFAGPRTRLLVRMGPSSTADGRSCARGVDLYLAASTRLDRRKPGKLRARAAVLQAKAEWDQHGRRGDVLLPAGVQLERARALLAESCDLNHRRYPGVHLDFLRARGNRKQAERGCARARRTARGRDQGRAGTYLAPTAKSTLGLCCSGRRDPHGRGRRMDFAGGQRNTTHRETNCACR